MISHLARESRPICRRHIALNVRSGNLHQRSNPIRHGGALRRARLRGLQRLHHAIVQQPLSRKHRLQEQPLHLRCPQAQHLRVAEPLAHERDVVQLGQGTRQGGEDACEQQFRLSPRLELAEEAIQSAGRLPSLVAPLELRSLAHRLVELVHQHQEHRLLRRKGGQLSDPRPVVLDGKPELEQRASDIGSILVKRHVHAVDPPGHKDLVANVPPELSVCVGRTHALAAGVAVRQVEPQDHVLPRLGVLGHSHLVHEHRKRRFIGGAHLRDRLAQLGAPGTRRKLLGHDVAHRVRSVEHQRLAEARRTWKHSTFLFVDNSERVERAVGEELVLGGD
mmetsp:Transcript_9972/g.31403  ORF Transcript_9972/g.31403 Transcript_9972/m.31403 type:complete len:335 (+) Transcript_9972:957-1961(+)